MIPGDDDWWPRRRRRRNHLGRVLAVIGITLLSLLAVGIAGGVAYVATLPSIDQLKPADIGQNPVIYAADGSLLGVVAEPRNRTVVRWRQISPWLVRSTIAIEDRRYWQHGALDYQGIARAAVKDLLAGHVVEGGSTIAQQVARNLYLPSQAQSRTFDRKIREAWLAVQLERHQTKAQILTTYLNIVFYGNNAWGAEAAAETYFHRHAQQLSLPEAALLAGLPQAPSAYDPISNPSAALARRNEVLKAMLDEGDISLERYAQAAATPLGLHLGRRYHDLRQPYFTTYVREQLLDKLGAQGLLAGGFTVHTTLDRRLQFAAQRAIKGILHTPGDPAAALVAIDPRTGAIVAMQSSARFDRAHQFNLAADARRQPGSTFKAVALAAAVARGIDPWHSYYLSAPLHYQPLGWAKPWDVSTAEGSYAGTISLGDATVASDNTVFARLALDLGAPAMVSMAHRLGIRSKLAPVYAMVLGADEVTPLELTSVYATLADGGIYRQPRAISSIVDSKGKPFTGFDHKPQRAISDGVASVVTGVLEQNIIRGTGVQARTSDRRPQAGKTGTAENYANAWFCGYTPDLATCVWIGYPAGNIPMTSVEGVSPVFGGTLPAQIWHDFMDVALKGVPPTPWPQPKTPAVLAPYRGLHAYDGGYTQPVAPAPTAPPTTTTTTTTQTPAPQPAPGKHP